MRNGVSVLPVLPCKWHLVAFSCVAWVSTAFAAIPVDQADNPASGRAIGSGNYGYVGEFGVANNGSAPSLGQFNHAYGIAIDPRDGTSLVVADSGNTSWGIDAFFSQVSGHSIQWVSRTAGFEATLGEYQVNGRYLDDDASDADPADNFGANFQFDRLVYRASETNKGPRGVALDSQGNAFVVLSQGPLAGPFVYKYGPDGVLLASFGTNASGQGRLGWPVGVAVDANDNVYVTSDGTDSITVFDNDGTQLSRYVGTGAGQLSHPQGVAVDPVSGAVFIASFGSSSFTPRITKVIPVSSGGVVDINNPAAWSWSLDTTFGTGGYVDWPWQDSFSTKSGAMSVDYNPETDELFVGKSQNFTQTILDGTTGAALGQLGSVSLSGAADGFYGWSRGAAFDQDGYVYVTSETSTGSRVQVFAKTPDAVAGQSAVPGDAQVTLNWTALPVGLYGQAPLLDYVVEYRETGAPDWILWDKATASTAPLATVGGLVNGTEYEFRVTPFNEAGSGDPSAVVRATPRAGGGPVVIGSLKPVPSLGTAALAVLSGLLAGLGFIARRRKGW